MKLTKKMSLLLMITILAGLLSASAPSVVSAQTPGPKMSVFELASSHT